MAVKPLWSSPPQFVDANGDPYSGALLFFYAAGSSTKQNTYTNSGGGTACDNPITLNSSGYPVVSGSIVTPFGTVGQTYKIGLAAPGSSDPPASFIWTADNIAPINDTTVAVDQWVSGPAPTYISATSFSLVGDQTSTFAAGRRLKFSVTAGTVYGTIYTSVFGALTTVTMVMDSSGNLDSGLSAVSYGLLSPDNPSLPAVAQQTLASASTVNLASARGPTLHISGTTTITSFGNAPSGLSRKVVFDGALTLTHNATSLILPGGGDITTADGDIAIFVSEGSGNWKCAVYQVAKGGPVGTKTNDDATAGNVGEAVESSVTGVTIATASVSNVTSISLTAGDWDVSGWVGDPAGTGADYLRAGLSLNSAAFTGTVDGKTKTYAVATAAKSNGAPVGPVRFSLSGTTTIYLVGQYSTTQTTTGAGYVLARRRR